MTVIHFTLRLAALNMSFLTNIDPSERNILTRIDPLK